MIALATTTIRVERQANLVSAPPTDVDPYGEDYSDSPGGDPTPAQPWNVIVSDVRATISNPSGNEEYAGGSQENVSFVLNCDPCDLKHYDRVIDERTGAVYDVVYSVYRVGLGLDHVRAGLSASQGAA